jgi:hypothetical protein
MNAINAPNIPLVTEFILLMDATNTVTQNNIVNKLP